MILEIVKTILQVEELKTSDVKIDDYDRSYLKITEPKKHFSTRYITPGEIMINRRKKSFKNWLDVWRPKVENQHSDDFVYLKPDGRPFKKESLRMFLNRKARPLIQTVFPEYYNYTARHFCAIARLIRTKIETRHFDVYEVKEWLGHTKIETTMGYLKYSKHFYKIAPFDWVHRALKKQSEMVDGESAKKSKDPRKNGFWLNFLRDGCTPPAVCRTVNRRKSAR